MESDAQDIVNLNVETDTLPNLKLELMPEDAPKLPYAYLHKQMNLSKTLIHTNMMILIFSYCCSYLLSSFIGDGILFDIECHFHV